MAALPTHGEDLVVKLGDANMTMNEETVSTSEMIELSGAALDVVAGGAKGDMGVDPVVPGAPLDAQKGKAK